VINVDNQQISATGDYFWKNFVFTVGIQRERSDFYNLFRSGSLRPAFPSATLHRLPRTTPTPSSTRNYYDPGRPPASPTSRSSPPPASFAQAKWDVSPRLNISTSAFAIEFAEAPLKPALNQSLLAASRLQEHRLPRRRRRPSRPALGFNCALDT